VRLRRAKSRVGFYTHQSIDKLLVEILEPMNRRVYDGCCSSCGVVVHATRFVEVHGGQRRAVAHIELETTHLPQQLRVLRRAGLGLRQQTGTTVTYTHSHPLAVDLLLVGRSRLHEIINDGVKSLTELQTDLAYQ
jgi:type I restriction enzyme M protein